MFDQLNNQSSGNFTNHSKILFRDEADATTRTMASIGAPKTAWSGSHHALTFNTGSLSETSRGEDYDYSIERMRIDSAGNVGIGTTAPRSQLDVRGAAGSPGHLSLSTAETTVVDGDILGRIDFIAPLEADGTGDSTVLAAAIYAEADATFTDTANQTSLIFSTGNSEAAPIKMRLDRIGNLFLNTGNEGRESIFGFRDRSDMGVRSNTAYSVGLMAPDNVHITTDSNNNGSSNYIDFGHGSSTIGSHTSMMRLVMTGTTGPGNLGIGTTSPDARLHVEGGANDEVVALFTTAGGTGGSTEGIVHIGLSHFTSDTVPSVSISAEENGNGSHQADFRINTRGTNSTNAVPTEKLRVTHDGLVGIGTTSPNAKLHVSGDTYIQSATANQLLRVHADTDSSPSPRIEMMRGAHDTWGTGDNYTDWRIENSNDLIFYSGFSSQSSGAAVERLRIHSDSDGLSINGTLVGLGQFVIFGEEGDLYSGTGSTGNANGYQFSYGNGRANVTNASNGTDFGINVPHNCVLERVDVVFGNSGNVSSGTTTFVVVKNGSNQSGNLSTTHSSGVHDSHHTGLSHTFSAGDRFNLRTTTSSRQVGPMRMTATFKRTA
jgi:hypothetical protein